MRSQHQHRSGTEWVHPGDLPPVVRVVTNGVAARCVRRSPSRLGPGDRHETTFGGPISGWCGRCPSRSRSSRRTLWCLSWLVALPYPWSRWVEQHFQRGARRSIRQFPAWVVLVRVAGGMVASVNQPGGNLGCLSWFACPRWRVATYFGAWSRLWRPRVDRPGHGETVATGAIVFTAWRAISWRGDSAGLVGCGARGWWVGAFGAIVPMRRSIKS